MFSDAELNAWGIRFTEALTQEIIDAGLDVSELSFQTVWSFVHDHHPHLTPEQAQWLETFLEFAFER